ncbi:neuropeptide FF receptor 2-like [Mercenaria mercenaria]|uniref:neuropeptide FF receptor 2-like n=1 Tax=Mercenaria mercenaria TaxID=6596 RepID=UPI00234FA4E0|nr:neuropeptide FF receptor 2-like [Mercenaria mercenaria]
MACEPGTEVPDISYYDPYITENFTAIGLPKDIPKWEIGLKVVFYIIAFLMDIVGNSIVILTVIMNKHMRTTINVLLLNLAISDIMVGCSCMWAHAGNSITKEYPFGANVCKMNTFVQVLAVIRMLIAVLTTFIICWTPQQVFILWDIFRTEDEPIENYIFGAKYAALYVAYSNSAINPVLYGCFNENFRKGFEDASYLPCPQVPGSDSTQ